MQPTQNKTAGTLQAPAVLSIDRVNHETANPHIVAEVTPSAKEFSTLRARFAIFGYQLTESKRTPCKSLWQVARWGQTRVLSHWHDVHAFLTQVGG